MAAELFVTPSRALDANADPYSGALAYFYATGTTTPQSVYTTSALNVAHANPVVADAGGKFAPIFFNAELSYRCVIKNSTGAVTLHDLDPVNTNTLTTLSASGGSALIGWLETGTGAVTRTLDAKIREQAISVIDFIPANLRAGIVANTGTTNVSAYFDAAATACVAQNRPLYVPHGTYPFLTWLPPANLTVLTDGEKTVFKQLDTGGVSTRLIHITTDNVSLWPGGSATIDGSIDTIAGNATEQNHGIFVAAEAGITIHRFTCGNVYGKNIGGDVILVYSPVGYIGHCTIGTIFGENIYRAIVAVSGGKSGTIEAIIQKKGAGVGAGLGALFFEPDATAASEPDQWVIGEVRGRTISIVGDPAHRLGAIRIDNLHLDFDDYGVSTPAYDEGGVSLATQPDTFLNAMRLRNFSSIDIGQAYIKGHTRNAIYGIASASQCDHLHFGTLILKEIDAASGTGEILLVNLRKFSADVLVDVDKPVLSVPTFVGSTAADLIEINGGEIEGRFCNAHPGDIDLHNVKLTGLAAENVFRNVDGRIRIRGGSATGVPAVMFEACPIAPVVEGWVGAGAAMSGTTPNVRAIRSTVNSVYYDDAWLTTETALASAAALTLPKYGNVIPISGTTNITSITADAGNKGRTVTLVFQGILTFTDGSNLTLAGNLVTTADDTITLSTADGTTWYEVCRSVN